MQEHPELRLLLDDEGSSPDRDECLQHLRGCAACRAAVAAEDPSRLFALLALEPVPEALLDRLSAAVADGISEPGSAPSRRSRGRGWVAVAASLLLASVFSTYLLDRDGRKTEATGAPAVSIAEERGAEPAFELLSPGTAQVVDLSVGGERFVMIFDEDLDL